MPPIQFQLAPERVRLLLFHEPIPFGRLPFRLVSARQSVDTAHWSVLDQCIRVERPVLEAIRVLMQVILNVLLLFLLLLELSHFLDLQLPPLYVRIVVQKVLENGFPRHQLVVQVVLSVIQFPLSCIFVHVMVLDQLLHVTASS